MVALISNNVVANIILFKAFKQKQNHFSVPILILVEYWNQQIFVACINLTI